MQAGIGMEQKKILWILFSAGLVLVLVAGTGFILFSPGDQGTSLAGSEETIREGSSSFDPIEWVRGGELPYPGLEEKDDTSSSGEAENGEGDDEFVIVYGESSDDHEVEQAEPLASQEERRSSEHLSEGESEESAPRLEQRQEVRSEPEPAVEPDPEPVQKRVSVLEYWIQAGSFQSRRSAEEAKELLSEKGFTGRLTSKTVDGKDFYRVRLGPYMKRAEAEKFLVWVQAIDAFQGSYISQVRSNKLVVVR